jgi:hypothetical protein
MHLSCFSLFRFRGIYKDVYGSSIPWHDYQLRPNQCIAMALVRNCTLLSLFEEEKEKETMRRGIEKRRAESGVCVCFTHE